MPEVYSQPIVPRHEETIHSTLNKPLNVESLESKARQSKRLYRRLASVLVHLGYWRACGNTAWADFYARESERIRRKLRPRRPVVTLGVSPLRAEIESWPQAPAVYTFQLPSGRVGEIRKETEEECLLFALTDLERGQVEPIDIKVSGRLAYSRRDLEGKLEPHRRKPARTYTIKRT